MMYALLQTNPTVKVARTLMLAAALLSACDGSAPTGANQANAGATVQHENTGGAQATFHGSSGRTGVGQTSGGAANASTNSSGTNASGSAAARGGAEATSTNDPKGGGTSTFNCKDIQCFRAIECVATCGGPILQSGCCACPNGSFDSIQCTSSGGGSSVSSASNVAGARAFGGSNVAAGANAKGGNNANAGANAKGGNNATGGSANAKGGNNATAGANAKGGATATGGNPSAAGAGSIVECTTASDCQVMGDCCGCYSFDSEQSSACPAKCPTTLTCSDFTPSPAPMCVAGHCVLDRSCNDSRVLCKRATPVCAAGKMPSVTPDGSCWDDNCIDVVDCSEVSSCDICRTNGLMCVYANGVRGVAHCVPMPNACVAMSNCSCFGSLCGSITPCTDIATGISCGGG